MYLASGGTLDWTLGVAGIPYRWTSKCVLASGIRFNSILIVYGHSRLFWWCCVIQGRAGSSLAFVILDLFGHQQKHQFDICFSYGMELPDTGMWGFLLPPNQIIPTGQSVNKLIQQQITTISVQNMFSVSSVEFTTFQCHREAPLIHGILLKEMIFCQVWAFHQIVGRQLILEFGSKRWKLDYLDQGRNKGYHSNDSFE